MSLDILRRSGGWCVELVVPIKTAMDKQIDHAIRWAEGRYASSLALLAEMCDVSENLLRELTTEDFDRVMLAYYNVVPQTIRRDFENGVRPLATPEEMQTPEERIPVPDPIDPRFPKVEGPVTRANPPTPAPPPPVKPAAEGMDFEPPVQMRQVS
jgi:hypothetical protein